MVDGRKLKPRMTVRQRRARIAEDMRTYRAELRAAGLVPISCKISEAAREKLNRVADAWGTNQQTALTYILETYEEER